MQATKSQITSCANVIGKLDSEVSKTFTDWAISVDEKLMETYGGEDLSQKEYKEDVEAILNEVVENAPWKNSTAKRQRKNEVKTIILGYNGLGAAAKQWQDDNNSMSKNVILALARALPTCEYYDQAIAVAKKKLKPKQAAEKTPAQKIGMGLGIIKNTKTTSRKYIEFRKALATLCKTHNIPY